MPEGQTQRFGCGVLVFGVLIVLGGWKALVSDITKILALLCAIVLCLAWVVIAARERTTGGKANNGYTMDFQRRGPPPAARDFRRQLSDVQREAMRKARSSGDFSKIREIMGETMTEERRERMRERREQRREAMAKTQAILGPQEFQRFQQKRQGRWGGRGGRRGRGGPGARGGPGRVSR